MTAFLVYWLNALGNPVLNRPHASKFIRAGTFPEHWITMPLRRAYASGRSIVPSS